jgi:hypothetical protein
MALPHALEKGFWPIIGKLFTDAYLNQHSFTLMVKVQWLGGHGPEGKLFSMLSFLFFTLMRVLHCVE